MTIINIIIMKTCFAATALTNPPWKVYTKYPGVERVQQIAVMNDSHGEETGTFHPQKRVRRVPHPEGQRVRGGERVLNHDYFARVLAITINTSREFTAFHTLLHISFFSLPFAFAFPLKASDQVNESSSLCFRCPRIRGSRGV